MLAFWVRSFMVPNVIEKIESMPLFPLEHYLSFWWMPLVFVSSLALKRLYGARFPMWDELKAVTQSIIISILIILTIATLSKQSEEISRLLIALFFLFLLFIAPLVRLRAKRALFALGIYKAKVGVVGTKESIIKIEKMLKKEQNLGYEVGGGFFAMESERDNLHIDSYKNFKKHIKSLGLSGVIVAVESKNLSLITNELQHHIKSVMFLPRQDGIAFLNAKIEHLFEAQQFMVSIENNLSKLSNVVIKKIVDMLLFLVILPPFLMLMIVISVAIRVDSRGGVFHIQQRLGEGDKRFYCLKFRSMYENSDKILDEYLSENEREREYWSEYKKLRGDDPRVTRVGRFLRASSLDELPQILNVFRGDMSFVGPRPYLPREIDDMGESKYIIRVAKPGITGLWQVMGRNRLTFTRRLELDEWYVRNWSLWLDFVIILKTFKAVMFR